MAIFRGDDAAITLGETGETGVTVTLAEAFPGDAAAMHTFDLLQVLYPDALAELITQDQPLATEFEAVADRIAGLGMHLVQVTL